MQQEEPRVFVYDDARHASCLYQMESPVEPGDLTYNVDQLVNSGFDTLILGMCLEGGIATYDSKVAPLWGDNVEIWTHSVWYRASRNLKQLIADGHDPMQIMVDRAHEMDIWFIASSWVNFVGVEREEWGGRGRHTDWVYEHTDYEVGPEDGPHATAVDPRRFSFLHEDVRQTRFVVYEEMLSRYETDGIQLDLTTFVPFCRFDQVNKLAPIMTQWIADLRDVANDASRQQGRPKRIYVRIPSQPDAWNSLGFDVPTWVSENLVDGVICVAGLNTGISHAHDVSDAVKLTRGTACRVLAGLSCNLGRQVKYYATPPMINAAAANAYSQGADGVGFIDAFFGPNGWPWHSEDYDTIRRLGHHDLLATADKHYRVPALMPHHSREWVPGIARQLPIELPKAEPVSVQLWMSDDLRRQNERGRVESVRLCVRISHIEAALNEVRVELNNQALADEVLDLNDLGYRLTRKSAIFPYGFVYEYHLTPRYFPIQGVNHITVTLVKRDKNITGAFELQDVDCMIKYRLHRHFRRDPLEY